MARRAGTSAAIDPSAAICTLPGGPDVGAFFAAGSCITRASTRRPARGEVVPPRPRSWSAWKSWRCATSNNLLLPETFCVVVPVTRRLYGCCLSAASRAVTLRLTITARSRAFRFARNAAGSTFSSRKIFASGSSSGVVRRAGRGRARTSTGFSSHISPDHVTSTSGSKYETLPWMPCVSASPGLVTPHLAPRLLGCPIFTHLPREEVVDAVPLQVGAGEEIGAAAARLRKDLDALIETRPARRFVGVIERAVRAAFRVAVGLLVAL